MAKGNVEVVIKDNKLLTSNIPEARETLDYQMEEAVLHGSEVPPNQSHETKDAELLV